MAGRGEGEGESADNEEEGGRIQLDNVVPHEKARRGGRNGC